MPSPPPKAPPRTKKSDIGVPFNFVHVNHVGSDFRSEDVKRALRPMVDNLQINENERCSIYEKVSHPSLETPIMAASSGPPTQEFSDTDVPELPAPLYEAHPPTTSSDETVPHYENVAMANKSQVNRVNSNPTRPSTKKFPPPPPPIGQKPKLRSEDEIEENTVHVVLRPEKEAVEIQLPPEPVNATPHIMEAPRISVVVDRPHMLDIRVHLDDKIPIQDGVSSKYRTPTMLTPSPQKAIHREMAVDVPIEYHISSNKRRAPEPPSAVKNVMKELQMQVNQKTSLAVVPMDPVIEVHAQEKKESPRPIHNEIYLKTGANKANIKKKEAAKYVSCSPNIDQQPPEQAVDKKPEQITSELSAKVEETVQEAATQQGPSPQTDIVEDTPKIEVASIPIENDVMTVTQPSVVLPEVDESPAPVPRPRTRKSLSTECSQELETPVAAPSITIEADKNKNLDVMRKKKNLSILPELDEQHDENEKENTTESHSDSVEQPLSAKEAWSVDSDPEEEDKNVIRL